MAGRFNTPLKTGLKGQRNLMERQKTEDGLGHKSVVVGREEYTYEVNIDWHEITGEMASKAASNSSKHSNRGPIRYGSQAGERSKPQAPQGTEHAPKTAEKTTQSKARNSEMNQAEIVYESGDYVMETLRHTDQAR